MPFPTAPVDWATIQRRWCAGEGSTSIAKSLPEMSNGRKLTRQAIDDRAEREHWVRGASPEAIEAARGMQATQALQAIAQVQAQVPDIKVPRSVAVMRGWGKKTPETIAKIITDLELGLSEARAAEHAGVSDQTILNWKKDDPEFLALVEGAKAKFRRDNLEDIHSARKRGDWKAGAYLVERSAHTRDDFKPPEATAKGGINIQVVLNIPRAEAQPGDEAIVIEGQTS